MSLLLSCQNISKSYGHKTLFESITFAINNNDRIGIVGPNGCGKSTLLKILTGHDQPDEGSVVVARGCKVAFVLQSPIFSPEQTLSNILVEAAKSSGMAAEQAEISAMSVGYQLGFVDLNVAYKNLSGGWKKRLAIACGIVSEPDLLILDEPTNHLDWEGIDSLKNLLKKAEFAWVMVSHDRYLLASEATSIVEVSPIYESGIFFHKGGYESYLVAKDEYINNQKARFESLQNKLRREEEWLRQGVKARTTKARFRSDAAYRLKDEVSKLNQKIHAESSASFALQSSGRKTKELVRIKNVSFSFGDKQIIKPFSFTFTSGQIIGVLGKNGWGKSSLLKLIEGKFNPTSGVMEKADHLQVVYFDQEKEKLPSNQTLQEVLTPNGGDSVVYEGRSLHVASFGKLFGFNRDQLFTKIEQLSGGERSRVLLARLLLTPADILLLDEPTNDLDIPTLELLEEELMSFQGSVVIVSHDRYLLQQVCTGFLGLTAPGVIKQFASIEQWQSELEPIAVVSKKNIDAVEKKEKKSNKLSYKEQLEYEQFEAKISQKEEELKKLQLESEHESVATNSIKSQEIFAKIESLQLEIEKMYERWSELESKVLSLN